MPGVQTLAGAAYRVNIRARNYFKVFIQLQRKCMFTKENLYANVYSDFIQNHQKLGKTPNSFLLMNGQQSQAPTVRLSDAQ